MDALPAGILGEEAPGAPGIPPTWCSSAKEMVGCSLGASRLWFTIGGGIVNEVYHPRIDIPQIRDLGFIVADGKGFWVEVKRLWNHDLRLPSPGIPAVRVVHRHERFELSLRITPDSQRDVLLIEVRLEGDSELRPYVLLAPHLGGSGHNNNAAVAEYRHRRVLWAEQGPFGLALAVADECQRDALGRASAGYVGMSDGWQDFSRHGAMRWHYQHAGPGNVALLGELPRQATLALGIGSSKETAATLAISALMQPFEEPWQRQIQDWESWHAGCGEHGAVSPDVPAAVQQQFFTSAMVLRAHQDKTFPGAMVASLSIPWGNTRDERGGYHLVWPRDLVECASALLALGGEVEAREVLRYLIATQHADGHWYQNQWLGGKPYWQGVQLDEAAFPVLLALRLAEGGALAGIEVTDMVRRALGFIVRTGPASDQDRWEEDAGINTFTLSVCIAALVTGAPLLKPVARDFVLGLADYWNAHIEHWTAVSGTALARRLGVRGYYVREAPAQTVGEDHALSTVLPIKNRNGEADVPADEQVGVDFLQLVRFGLRRADDPLIVDSLKVVDALLKVDTPSGPSWHRYNGDGYGEHEDGSAFDGAGKGRAWPLLTGERGHYELAAGRDATPYLEAMASMSGSGGMLPEQIWDSEPLVARALHPGRPSGSAMPLAWAHAEFIKLFASRQRGRPLDLPAAVWQRYQGERPDVRNAFWLPQAPLNEMAPATVLYVGLYESGTIHWGVDDWREPQDVLTQDTGMGVHIARLATQDLRNGARILFTYRSTQTDVWAGRDYTVSVSSALRTVTEHLPDARDPHRH
jgi:glucoamylase